jgi:hypothetical protein
VDVEVGVLVVMLSASTFASLWKHQHTPATLERSVMM